MRLPASFRFQKIDAESTRVCRTGGTLLSLRKVEQKELVIKCPIAKLRQGMSAWVVDGKFIQDALPLLTTGEREFLMTGTTPEEWEVMFGHE